MVLENERERVNGKNERANESRENLYIFIQGIKFLLNSRISAYIYILM